MALTPEEKARLLKRAKEDTRVFHGASPVGVSIDGKSIPGIKILRYSAAQGLRQQTPVARRGLADFGDIPEVVKRTETQKVEHMAARLWESVQNRNYDDIEGIMRIMQAEGWARGTPITYDDVRRIVIDQLKLAAAKIKEQQDKTF